MLEENREMIGQMIGMSHAEIAETTEEEVCLRRIGEIPILLKAHPSVEPKI